MRMNPFPLVAILTVLSPGLSLGASPLAPRPLGASPLGASALGASPLGASPLGASPLGASPLGASPLEASRSGASSADPTVDQKGRAFSVDAIVLKRGERVVFRNNDTVPHNIMSETPGNTFDLGSQMPGTATQVSFDSTGDIAVICAIHPRMRMTVTVIDKDAAGEKTAPRSEQDVR